MRLLIGSLVLGGGILALGMLFGGGTANAAEPPAPSPLGGVISAVASVAPAAPVEAVVSPVAQAADRVVAAPVELVAPGAATPASGGASTATASGAPALAAGTPDAPPATPTSSTLALVRTLAAPLSPVTSLLANHPVSTLTAPIAAAADGVLAGVAGVVADTVQPLAVPAGAAAAGEQSAVQPVGVEPAVARVAAADTERATGFSDSPAAAPATGAPSALLTDAPHGDSDVPVPGTLSGVLGMSTSGAQAGGHGSGVATLGGSASPATALGLRAGIPADDDLTTSPVFDHDISPD